jgi:hypothetical protein
LCSARFSAGNSGGNVSNGLMFPIIETISGGKLDAGRRSRNRTQTLVSFRHDVEN